MTISATRTSSSAAQHDVALRRVALLGNPNAGKTTLFNALTGMRQKVGNYPWRDSREERRTLHFARRPRSHHSRFAGNLLVVAQISR
jgi:50S ribosomal subunit-associated GTPase HflX